jgi:hypothetical protein
MGIAPTRRPAGVVHPPTRVGMRASDGPAVVLEQPVRPPVADDQAGRRQRVRRPHGESIVLSVCDFLKMSLRSATTGEAENGGAGYPGQPSFLRRSAAEGGRKTSRLGRRAVRGV